MYAQVRGTPVVIGRFKNARRAIAHTGGVSAAYRAIVRRDQVQGRLHNVVSSLSMVYGLVFSGVAGSALSPLKAVDYDEDTYHRTLANL